MALSSLCIRRPVTTMMLYTGLSLIGIISFRRLSIDFLPHVSIPRLTIQVLGADLSPEEIDENVAQPIAAAAGTVRGVTKTSSLSRRGLTLVTVEFSWGVDMDYAMLELREKLDQLQPDLPPRAGRPTILRMDPNAEPVITVAVTSSPSAAGGDPAGLLELTETCHALFKKRLEQVEGVAQARVLGGLEPEMQVRVHENKLLALGLTIKDVARAIGMEDVRTPGGSLMKGSLHFPVRMANGLKTVNEIAGLSIPGPTPGRRVLLTEVATLHDTIRERTGWARFHGQDILVLELRKEAGSNTLLVSENVRRTLERLEQENPGIRVYIFNDQAEFIRSSVADVEQSILWGAVFALLTLFAFLKGLRDPLIVGVSMPASILATLIAMHVLGISLNVISLTGLAIGIGMLGDNAIILVENVRRLREDGASRLEAVVAGSREINLAVTASTLTNVAIFLPILFVEGVAQQLFVDMAITMTVSLFASLFVAVTLVPVLRTWELPDILRPGVHLAVVSRARNAIDAWCKRCLDRMLDQALASRGTVLYLTAGLLGLSVVAAFLISSEPAPEIDRKGFTVDVTLHAGLSGPACSELAQRIERILGQVSGIGGLFLVAGVDAGPDIWSTQPSSAGRIHLEVRVADDRETRQVMEKAREQMGLLCKGLAGALVSVKPAGTTFERLLRPQPHDIVIRVLGDEALVRRRIAEELGPTIEQVPGLVDLNTPVLGWTPEYHFMLDRLTAGRFGITPRDVAEHISSQIGGQEGIVLSIADRQITMRVQPDDMERKTMEDLLSSCMLCGGTRVPLSSLVACQIVNGYAEVRREGIDHALVMTANAAGRSIGAVAGDLRQRADAFALPPGYSISIGGENEEMESSFRSLGVVIGLSLLLVYMILAAEYESLLYPFVILLTSPLAFCGAVLAMLVAGEQYNVMSLVGIVIMIGAVDNDAVIAVDVITSLRRSGVALRDAVRRGMHQRLRPILMTTTTTIMGIVPLIFNFGEGSELVRALAIPLAGGLVTSTIFTLVVIPVLYTSIDPWAARNP